MASFPRRTPSKTGSSAGRRRFFGREGSDAGYPGPKQEVRQAKHRVAAKTYAGGAPMKKAVGTRCTVRSRSGERCKMQQGHDSRHSYKEYYPS